MVSVDPKRACTTLVTALAFVVIAAALFSLWLVAREPVTAQSNTIATSIPLAALLLTTWVIIFLTAIVLIRDSRPYSASWAGRLVTWLAIGIILIVLATLLTLTRALTTDSSSTTSDADAPLIPTAHVTAYNILNG